MKRISKMLGAGLGSALATVAVFAIKQVIPDMDPSTAESVRFAIYTVLTMGGAYAAPANTP